MRLDKLTIAGFKNLRQFTVDFDETSPTTVLVGRNGTGKSNLLEALIRIFQHLDLGKSPPFNYELAYICRGHHVHIAADPSREREQLALSVDGVSVPFRKSETKRDYLPNFVFGYYSGPSNRMEKYFEEHQKRFYDDLLAGVDNPLRPLFYARLVHSQFVLLAFFTVEDKAIRDFLKEYLWIEGLDSVLFIMQKPSWKSKTGDPRFWYARGTVSGFLDKLYGLSLAPLRHKPSRTAEYLYLYLQDLETLRKLAGEYRNQQEFFKALESTYISELISEVRIKVKIRAFDGSLTFRELSEGEQQLLMVLGLLRFTQEDESLFLLDEPDTHLNPAWSLRYLEFVESIVGKQPNSHIIMTTHDPLTVAGLTRSQVQVMQRDEETGRISAKYAEEDPRGKDIGELLTSDLYGLRTTLSPQVVELLDRQRELAAKTQLTGPERKELDVLNEQLEGMDLTKASADPLYEPFVRAMAAIEKEQGLQLPVLNDEQREERLRLATELLRNLKLKKDNPV